MDFYVNDKDEIQTLSLTLFLFHNLLSSCEVEQAVKMCGSLQGLCISDLFNNGNIILNFKIYFFAIA